MYTSWMSGPRSDFTWPRVVEAELCAAGWPNEVRSTAIPAELTKSAYPTWHREILAWSPDVVVMDYGRMECVHLFIPRWLERYANNLGTRPHPVRQAYRKRVVRPLWRSLVFLQRALDSAMPTRATLWRVRRGERDIAGLIDKIRTVASPLVLILEAPPFGRPYQKWFPGANARVEIMNDALRALVRRLDEPDIRFVTLADVWAGAVDDGKDVCPDGGHYTPPLHRAVGEEVAGIVIDWADKQHHLDLTEVRARRAERRRA
jgi:hypothetical protein